MWQCVITIIAYSDALILQLSLLLQVIKSLVPVFELTLGVVVALQENPRMHLHFILYTVISVF